MQFFGDDFLRVLLLRYVFCYIVLYLHRGFKVSQINHSSSFLTNDLLMIFSLSFVRVQHITLVVTLLYLWMNY